MSDPRTREELRATWTEAVAAANRVIVKIDDERGRGRPRPRRLERLEAQLHVAEEAADVAYREFVRASSDWITASPVRQDVVVVAGTMKATEGDVDLVVPALTFAFRGNTDSEAITVTLALTEMKMRQVQRSLSMAIDDCIKAARDSAKGTKTR